MDKDKIENIIQESNLGEVCYPRTGDCVSVAVAIKELFGGEFVCGYQNPTDLRPAHATVRIDNNLYDGMGSLNTDTLYDIATSGLKKSERQSIDDHIGPVKSLKDNALYDKGTKDSVKKRIKDNI